MYALLIQKPFLLPKILDIIQRLEGFQYATTLDLNMGYYTIRLDPAAQDVCTIVTPFGKYAYTRLPMGLCNAPDIFQEKMASLLEGLDYVRAYLDDLLVLSSNDLDDHLEKLSIVFDRLHNAGLKVQIKNVHSVLMR